MAATLYPDLPPALLAGALTHLQFWLATGCERAGAQAAFCLTRLARNDGLDPSLSHACEALADTIADGESRTP